LQQAKRPDECDYIILMNERALDGVGSTLKQRNPV